MDGAGKGRAQREGGREWEPGRGRSRGSGR